MSWEEGVEFILSEWEKLPEQKKRTDAQATEFLFKLMADHPWEVDFKADMRELVSMLKTNNLPARRRMIQTFRDRSQPHNIVVTGPEGPQSIENFLKRLPNGATLLVQGLKYKVSHD